MWCVCVCEGERKKEGWEKRKKERQKTEIYKEGEDRRGLGSPGLISP